MARKLGRHKLARISLVILGFLYFVALFGDFLAPYSLTDYDANSKDLPPSAIHFSHDGKYVGPFIYRTEKQTVKMSVAEKSAAQRAANGQNNLYRMGDAISITTPVAPAYGLPGKDPAVMKVRVTAAGTTFPDIAGHPNKAAIEALAARGIINGYNASQFGPNDKITRAQFAKITIMALGMSAQKTSAYSDVASDAWYAG